MICGNYITICEECFRDFVIDKQYENELLLSGL